MKGAGTTESHAKAGGPQLQRPSAFRNCCVRPGPSTCCSGHSPSERDFMRLSEKIYRVLLRAYPRDYRSRYAESMEQLFRDRLRQLRPHSFIDFVALWRRMLTDWAVSVPARYWERVGPHIHSSPLADPARRYLFF